MTTDLTSGVRNLTTKLIDIQKQKLINKGMDTASELLGGILSENANEKDSTITSGQDQTGEAVKDVLGGILGGGKQTKDSINQDTDTLSAPPQDPVKDAAKNILGGFLGGKKKKDTAETKNDTIH